MLAAIPNISDEDVATRRQGTVMERVEPKVDLPVVQTRRYFLWNCDSIHNPEGESNEEKEVKELFKRYVRSGTSQVNHYP